jgi:hypothetical protein
LTKKRSAFLRVTIGNSQPRAEYVLTNDLCIESKMVDQIAFVISHSRSKMAIIIPNKLKNVQIFRNENFLKKANKKFEIMFYDETGNIMKIKI